MISPKLILVTVCFGFSFQTYIPCSPKDFGHGSAVCVCNQTFCDGFESIPILKPHQYVLYTSTKDGLRFSETIGNFSQSSDSENQNVDVKISIDTSKTYQSIIGFGGAFTDSATINIYKFGSILQERIFDAYYSKFGIEYSTGRIPMASCDFSTKVYSYDDYDQDFMLENFTLASFDLELKIPAIKEAASKSKHSIKLFASPWSAPAWMKTNKLMQHPGTLIGNVTGKYHKTWANYFIKFLKAYESQGIKLWGLTVENEPTAGLAPSYAFQCMGFLPEDERDFIKKDLGPTLAANGYKDIKLMMLDDQRLFLKVWADTILGDPDAKKYVSGIGLHWYMDFFTPVSFLDDVHKRFPDAFILPTEACAGYTDNTVILGSWERGEKYGHSIMENLNHWAAGWTDWNLVLDMQGGPNWVKNFVDSPIIADHANAVFYKQPTFYHMGHFSKFLEPGSVRVSTTVDKETLLEYTAFVTPSNSCVLVILNRQSISYLVQISEKTTGNFMAKIPERSIQTFKWD
eukprot:gene10154-11191_t